MRVWYKTMLRAKRTFFGLYPTCDILRGALIAKEINKNLSNKSAGGKKVVRGKLLPVPLPNCYVPASSKATYLECKKPSWWLRLSFAQTLLRELLALTSKTISGGRSPFQKPHCCFNVSGLGLQPFWSQCLPVWPPFTKS